MFRRQRRPFAGLSALGPTFLSGALALLGVTGLGLLATPSAHARSEAAKPSPQPKSAPQVLPFIENNYAAARATALRKGKLLLVDAWALWCHTCLSMKNFVFTDPQLAPLADQLVYLAIDTEEPANLPFLQRFPISSLPTFLVLDGEEKVVARWTGAMSAAELKTRLLDVTSMQVKQHPRLSEAEAEAAKGHPREAARLYEDALNETGSRPQALLGLVQALRELGQNERCVEVFEQNFQLVGKNALATDFASYAASCIDKLGDVDRRQKLRRRLRSDLEHLLHDAAADLSVDDRSDGYGTMIELSDELGETVVGDGLATTRLGLLEKEAAAAPNPIIAATFDAHRFDCYRRLKRWKSAEEMLLGSAKALPTDYNPPARLARLYYETGRIEEAQRSIDLALSLCHGPRRVGMYELRAGIQNSQGRTRAALESLTTAISIHQASQPASVTVESARLRALKQQVAGLESKLREQPEPPDDAMQPKTEKAGSPTKKKPGAKPSKANPTPISPPRYEPGMPIAGKKRDRRVAHRESSLK